MGIKGKGQEVLGHDDCPYFKSGGVHDCAKIHEHLHQIPQCMPAIVTVSVAEGVGLSIAVVIAALATH